MYAIYGNMDPINISPMLAYIPYMDPMGYTGDIFPGKKAGFFPSICATSSVLEMLQELIQLRTPEISPGSALDGCFMW